MITDNLFHYEKQFYTTFLSLGVPLFGVAAGRKFVSAVCARLDETNRCQLLQYPPKLKTYITIVFM